jgi:sialic acid synthase SpsE
LPALTAATTQAPEQLCEIEAVVELVLAIRIHRDNGGIFLKAKAGYVLLITFFRLPKMVLTREKHSISVPFSDWTENFTLLSTASLPG